MATLPQVAALSDILRKFELRDDVPNIEVTNASIHYDVADPPSFNSTGYVDALPFGDEHGLFKEESRVLGNMEALLREGEKYVNMLYTYRSAAKALPMVTAENKDRKMEIYKKSFQALRPEISKLTELMEFQKGLVERFSNTIQSIASNRGKGRVVPDEITDGLVRLVDLVITLDIEKDFKVALQNDFAFFKRAFHNVKMEIKNKNAIAEEINDLQMFLADPRCPKSIILNTLKQTVVTIHGHEDVLTDIFTWCMRQIEDGLYLLPEDKWMMIRFCPTACFSWIVIVLKSLHSMSSKPKR